MLLVETKHLLSFYLPSPSFKTFNNHIHISVFLFYLSGFSHCTSAGHSICTDSVIMTYNLFMAMEFLWKLPKIELNGKLSVFWFYCLQGG